MIEEKIWKSELAEDAFISYKTIPFHFHTVDRSLLRVANKAIGKGKKIVINYPLHRCDLLVPIALEACYTLIGRKKNKVLLVTSKLSAREFYEDLMQAGGKVSNNLFPIGMVSRTGGIKPIYQTLRGLRKEYKDYIRDSVVFLSSSLKYLPSDASLIGAIVFDLRQNYDTEAIDYVLEWSNAASIPSVIFVISESQTENVKRFNSLGIPIWGWTPSMLKKEFELEDIKEESLEAPFYRSAIEVRRIAKGLKRRMYLVETPESFKRMLYDSYKFFKDCWKIFQAKRIPLLREALFTYSRSLKAIERMSAPMKNVIEEEESAWGVLSLRKRVEKLGAIQKKLSEDEPLAANLLSSAASNMERLKDWLLENDNPKYKELLSLMQENKGRKICFAFFRACDKSAALSALHEKLNLSEEQLNSRGIFFATYAEIDSMTQMLDVLCIMGAVPQYARFLLRSSQAEEILFMTYPTEVAVLEREIIEDNDVWNNEFSLDERAHAIGVLIEAMPESLKPRIREQYAYAKPPEMQAQIARELKKEGNAEKIGNETVSNFFADLLPRNAFAGEFGEDVEEQDEDFAIDYESDDAIFSEGGVEVNAIKIDFEGGESIAVQDSKRLPVFLEFKDHIIYKEACRISKKDIVLIINKGTKDTLAQSMFKVLHSLPSMRSTVTYAQSWVAMLVREMKKARMDSWDVLRELQRRGSEITEPLTITHWTLGETIGPRDKKDILRIGQAFNNKFLLDNFKRISEAVTALRGIHHKLVNRLRLMIPKAGVKVMRQEPIEDEMISPELGLHVEDFYNAISLKRVAALTKVRANYSICNKLLRSEDFGELEERKDGED